MEKLRKKINFGHQYFRHLCSYMTILLIPLVILTFFYSSRFMKKFYNEIFETVDLELIQIGTQLENQWSSMQGIVNQLALTGIGHQASVAQSPLELEPVIDYLSGFCTANPFITDIALVLDNQDYVSNRSTTCKKDYYFDRMFQISDMNGTALQELLPTYHSPICVPGQVVYNLGINSTKEDFLIFVFPLFTDYQKQEGSVLFFVKDSSIQSFWSKKLEKYQAQIYILDQNGTIIADSQVNPQAMMDSSSDYIVRTHTSGKNGWSYLAYIPDRSATFSQVSSITREFILAIVLTLFLSSLAIYVLQKVNYAPVRRLMNKAKQFTPESGSKDEMAAISNALDFLSNQNTTLSTKLEKSLTAVKNERLYRLLSGSYSSREDFNLDCSELNLFLPNPYFSVIILMLHQPASDLDKLSYEVKSIFENSYTYYYLHTFHSNQIVLLTNPANMSDSLEKPLQKLQTYLQKNYNMLTTIGVGRITNDTKQIAQSYIEASSALDYRFVKGNGTIIHFQEIIHWDQASVLYPNQEFEALKNALISHNESVIHTSIENIIIFMEQNQMPLYLARGICFELIRLVNEHCQRQKSVAGNSPIELSGMETAQEIIRLLHSWNAQLKDLTEQSSKKAVIEDVLVYINENCLRCDFSAYEAAEYFHMALPAFSKFFKDSTGQNVMDYTIHMRIQKAKELLSHTNLPLKDIGEQVGYYNISSFTRRFKLNQGITPSEYRKISASKTY